MKTKINLLLLACFVTLCSCKTDSNQKKQVPSQEDVQIETPKKVVIKEAPFVYGIDISQYQGNEAFDINSKKDSLGFIFCKATEGETYMDPDFEKNWNQIKKDGFARGVYHFYRSVDNPISQANFFAKTIQSIDSTDIPPVVDFEAGGIDKSQSVEKVQIDLNIFLETLEKQLGRKPMIYTDIPVADKYLNDPKYADYALWIANYNGKSSPDLPITWKEKGWTFWQRDASYKLENFTDDSDVFNGDKTALQSFIESYK